MMTVNERDIAPANNNKQEFPAKFDKADMCERCAKYNKRDATSELIFKHGFLLLLLRQQTLVIRK